MGTDLDPETLLTLSMLMEIENQSRWALSRIREVEARLKNYDGFGRSLGRSDRQRAWADWFENRHELFGAIQAFLTSAGIADSLLTGRGPPRPKGLVGLTDAQRRVVRSELGLPEGFEIGGRPQRNSLVHIEERLVEWSKPGRARADFAVAGIDRQDPDSLREVLRVLDRKTLQFAVLGETCNLAEVRESLVLLRRASATAHARILEKINADARAQARQAPAAPNESGAD